ncbi:MAG TPA: hypothetical protein ENI23_09395 [bacterium]|nr:hypothetical protein [bacterium]
MSGYPFAGRIGTESVEISRDSSNLWENFEVDGKLLNPNIRFDIIYSLDKTLLPTDPDDGIYYQKIMDLEIVIKQVAFYMKYGFKIFVIDTDELFQIRAEKNVDDVNRRVG